VDRAPPRTPIAHGQLANEWGRPAYPMRSKTALDWWTCRKVVRLAKGGESDAYASNRFPPPQRGRAKVLKMESGANTELASGLAVSAAPTVVAFRDGKEVGRLVGLRPESAYCKLLEAAGVEG
jgi:hypothetical protein